MKPDNSIARYMDFAAAVFSRCFIFLKTDVQFLSQKCDRNDYEPEASIYRDFFPMDNFIVYRYAQINVTQREQILHRAGPHNLIQNLMKK